MSRNQSTASGGFSVNLLFSLAFLSGVAALSHELLWTRRLYDVLGATDWVAGRVLGLFFLGISLGSLLATRLPKMKASPLKQLALAELGIAILTCPAIFLPGWTEWIWRSMGTEGLASWQGAAVKLSLAALVVLPPAIVMGFTLPLMIRAANQLHNGFKSASVWIYTLNTLGGVVGLWFTSTLLIQRAGVQNSMFVIAAVNIGVGLFALLMSVATKTSKASTKSLKQESAGAPSQRHSIRDLMLLSFASGFIVLSLEILLLRLLALVVPSSYHTTSALLANVIMLLAVGSGVVAWYGSRKSVQLQPQRLWWLLVIGMLGTALFASLSPVILFEQTDKLMSIRYLQGLNNRTIESVGHFWLLVSWLVLISGGLALTFSGLVFPSILAIHSPDEFEKNQVGFLLAANGVGGLIGSEVTNSFFVATIGVYQSFSVLAAIALLVVSLPALKLNRRFFAAGAFIGCCLIGWSFWYGGELPYISPRAKTKFEVKGTHFGREGVLLVVEDPKGSKSIMANGQYVLGSSGVSEDQRRQLSLPWLFKQDAENVCCLGLATGISASGLERLPEPPDVTAVELSANVEQISRSYFKGETGGFFSRDGNRVIVDDARIYMVASVNEFDLIVGDLYRPHGSGEARLFTVEHFQNVKRSLTDDGVFCQWLPIYQLNQENFLAIAATFQHVYPNTLVVYGNCDLRYPVIGLVGRKDDKVWHAKNLLRQLQEIPPELKRSDPLLAETADMIVGTLLPLNVSAERLNTLDNMNVEIAAGNFWILKDLRKNRRANKASEFISGAFLRPFNQELERMTKPVFPRAQFRRFLKSLYTAKKP